jgi:preprotein translocase subunit Sec63
VILRLIVLVALVLAVWRVVRSLLPPASPGPARPSGPPGWDPYAVLGIARGASVDDVTHAYRELMKQYHPDKVATLGPELRELAHEKTVEIQRAYDQLRK